MDLPTPGDRYLGPTGRIWTVVRVTAVGDRVHVVTPGADGEEGAVIDLVALARMVALDAGRPTLIGLGEHAPAAVADGPPTAA